MSINVLGSISKDVDVVTKLDGSKNTEMQSERYQNTQSNVSKKLMNA